MKNKTSNTWCQGEYFKLLREHGGTSNMHHPIPGLNPAPAGTGKTKNSSSKKYQGRESNPERPQASRP
ncbi:MAG: hypothetical protein AAF597_20065, partial [Bacteroidota bacterium]